MKANGSSSLDLCSIVQRMNDQRLLLHFIHLLEQHLTLSVGCLSCLNPLGNLGSSLVHELRHSLGHSLFLQRLFSIRLLKGDPKPLTMLKGDPWLAVRKNTAHKTGRLPVLRHALGQHDGSWACKEGPEFGRSFRNKSTGANSLAQNNNKNNTLGGREWTPAWPLDRTKTQG